MPMLELSDEQVIELVTQLSPEKQESWCDACCGDAGRTGKRYLITGRRVCASWRLSAD